MARVPRGAGRAHVASTGRAHADAGATVDPESRTRERLLHAAEVLFARRGFGSTSVRAITTMARCNLAGVNYHFGSKAGLYRRMFESLLARLRDRRDRDLRRALDQLGADADLESFLRTFTGSFLESYLDEREGGRRLMQLFSRELLDPRLPPNMLRQGLVRPVRDGLTRALHLVGIDASSRSGRRCIESLLAQLMHVVRMSQAPHVTGAAGREDFELREMVDHIARFSAAGLRSCAAPRRAR
ncbi:MAG TPA: CerR family C-terminal domain-containing protein [Candidatus Polarisedimenticolia bacterium]|nr:CerR family C-terminal domain-containing protein [Candidatus Polarisedimenticolia bacterium]